MHIRIVGVPSGVAPEEIRKCWLGIEMESIGKEDPTDKDVLIGREGLGNLGGYMVLSEKAFSALEVHNKKAYDWWVANCPRAFFGVLVFRAEICEVIRP